MNQKRNRSQNWDGEEKQLFCVLLKEYAKVIESKCLDTNSNKMKTKAWEEFHKKFNEINSRNRELNQMKIQWKKMKVDARKTFSNFKKETTKTGGGTRPPSPDDTVIEIKDLLNPGELLRDHNIYDSDGIDSRGTKTDNVEPLVDVSVLNENILCNSKTLDMGTDYINLEDQQIPNIYMDTIESMDIQESTSSVISQRNESVTTPKARNMTKLPKKVINISQSSKRNDPAKGRINDYKTEMINHSKKLKDEEFKRRMEMAEEEHAIKMLINKEKLKCMIIEREILEKKKNQIELKE